MDLGFETIGNATVIGYDRGPVLATDPWVKGPAYFGSWVLTHQVPPAQMEAIRQAPYLWISHGHPDHLSPESLEDVARGSTILLPDHFGGRIRQDLEAQGHSVRVLKDGEWTPLSERIKVCSIGDYCQDAVLLLDIGGRLVVNANDAADRGAGSFLQQTARAYEESYLLCLTGHGDADMINFFDESGRRLVPPAAEKAPLGPGIAGLLQHFGLKHFVPSSSMHKYGRTDSAWANDFITPIGIHEEGFDLPGSRVLPPFVHCDFMRDEVLGLEPPATPDDLRPPEDFGDCWSDELEAEDLPLLEAYFRGTSHLHTFLGFVNCRVGGKDNVIRLAPEHAERGLTFETPRHSLMEAVRWEVFDDLLIGNYTKTTLHGPWEKQGTDALYPDFGPFLTKYGDNGGARTPEQLRAYFRAYRERGFFGFPETMPGAAEWRRSIEPYLS